MPINPILDALGFMALMLLGAVFLVVVWTGLYFVVGMSWVFGLVGWETGRPTQAPNRPAYSTPYTHPVTSLTDLQSRLADFRDERNWARYHDPKSLACALGAEVGELLEVVQWLSPEEIADLSPARRDALAQELADIVLYATNLANSADIDLAAAVEAKLALNADRYPPGQAPASRKERE